MVDRIAQEAPEAISRTGTRAVGRLSRYDIFQKLPEIGPTWVETAPTLESAEERLKQLKAWFPAADYFIFDTEHARFIAPASDFRSSGSIMETMKRPQFHG